MGTDGSDREAELERHRENLERLHEAANRLHEAASEQGCYDITIEAAVNILGFDWCTVAGPTATGEEFELVAVSAEAPLDVGHRPFGIDEGLAGQVYRTKESSVVVDAHDWKIAVAESSDGGARFEITGVEFAR